MPALVGGVSEVLERDPAILWGCQWAVWSCCPAVGRWKFAAGAVGVVGPLCHNNCHRRKHQDTIGKSHRKKIFSLESIEDKDRASGDEVEITAFIYSCIWFHDSTSLEVN